MNSLTETLAVILSSSVIATIISSFFNYKIQEYNYKKEFYKKLIDERLYAYMQVVMLINELKIQVYNEDGIICNRLFENGKKYYDNFIVQLVSTANYSIWFSKELDDYIQELNIFLLDELNMKTGDETKADNRIKSIGTQITPKISEIRKKIEKQLYEDFADMDNLKEFLKATRKRM